jgi:hypothetical protein
VWLIGEQNPYGANPEHALYPLPEHAAGARLARVLGLQKTEYLRAFVRKNLLTSDRWSVPDARAAARAILGEQPEQDRLVLLGARVATAFGVAFRDRLCQPPAKLLLGTPDLFQRARMVVVIPHPSGLSREWNTPGIQDRVRDVVCQLREGTVDARPIPARAST